MIDLQAEATREEYALRLGLPADSHPADVLAGVINMFDEDIAISQLQALAREMGAQLRLEIRPREGSASTSDAHNGG